MTLTYSGLGLYRGREHVFNLTASPPSSPGEEIDVRSACVNPICDAHWEWLGKVYRVRGLEKGEPFHELKSLGMDADAEEVSSMAFVFAFDFAGG